MLGTLVEITLDGDDDGRLHRAADAGFREIERIHWLMSFHSESSDVTRLNLEACRRPVAVDPHTWEVLALAQRVSRATQGAFDVTIGAATMGRDASPGISRACDARVSFEDVELLPRHRVRFHRRLMVDLGGIAKGYAVDRAVDALRALGLTSGCVNAGGDLRIFGPDAVSVYVRDPQHPGRASALVQLLDCAFATTASYPESAYPAAGMVVDPRTSCAPCVARSASVRAATCAIADALAKSVYLLRQRAGSALAQFSASGFLLDRGGLSVVGAPS